LQHIPIVMLTTSAEERDIAFTLKAGAYSFLTKPATFDEWIDIMRSLSDVFAYKQGCWHGLDGRTG